MSVAAFLPILLSFLADNYLIIVVCSILLNYLINRERRNVPPGPIGLPIVGYIPFLGNLTAPKQLWELSKKYGKVFTLKLGPKNVVFINDHKFATEAMSDEAFMDRPEPNIFSLFSEPDSLLTWRGAIFKEHRKFTLKALRTVGVGKSEVENLVLEEIDYMLDRIAEDGEKYVRVSHYLGPSSSNMVNMVITGKRYNYDHPVRVMQDKVFCTDDLPALCFTGYFNSFIEFGTILAKLPLKFTQFFKDAQMAVNHYLNAEVSEAMDNYDENNPKNIISAYLAELNAKKTKGEETFMDLKHISPLASDLLGAGSGTVKDTVEWTLLYLAAFPDIQEKVIHELAEVIGFDRRPCYADRAKMPIMQSVIWESMRHSSIIPINLPHVATRDSAIAGYTIPKGYHIYVNFWAIHNDPEYWHEPEKFDHTRFLSPEGTKLLKHEAFMPFSTGRRLCVGEPLAQVELFMYLAVTLQRFKVGAERVSLEGKMATFAYVPVNCKLSFTTRVEFFYSGELIE